MQLITVVQEKLSDDYWADVQVFGFWNLDFRFEFRSMDSGFELLFFDLGFYKLDLRFAKIDV